MRSRTQLIVSANFAKEVLALLAKAATFPTYPVPHAALFPMHQARLCRQPSQSLARFLFSPFFKRWCKREEFLLCRLWVGSVHILKWQRWKRFQPCSRRLRGSKSSAVPGWLHALLLVASKKKPLFKEINGFVTWTHMPAKDTGFKSYEHHSASAKVVCLEPLHAYLAKSGFPAWTRSQYQRRCSGDFKKLKLRSVVCMLLAASAQPNARKSIKDLDSEHDGVLPHPTPPLAERPVLFSHMGYSPR